MQQRGTSGIFLSFLFMLLLVGVGLCAGYFYAFSQPTQWKVSAQFEPPKVAELGNYYSLYNTYSIVQNDGKSDPNLEQTTTQLSFAEFTKSLGSHEAAQVFFSQNVLVKQIAAAYYQTPAQAAKQMVGALHFDSVSNRLSIVLANPEQGVQILNEYINHHTEQVRNSLNTDLISKWKVLFQNVKQSAEANLGQTWQAKLNLMRSVQPLDNALIPYRFVNKPLASAEPEQPQILPLALAIGGGIGLFLSILIASALFYVCRSNRAALQAVNFA